jgi:hypothetical protein
MELLLYWVPYFAERLTKLVLLAWMLHHDFTLVQERMTLVHEDTWSVLRLVQHDALLREASLMALGKHLRLLSQRIAHVD